MIGKKGWRLLLIPLLVLLASPAPLFAAGGEAAQFLVRDTSERMLSILRAERETIDAHPERIYSLVDETVLPHFDFRRMARWVLGKHWRRADDEQRERFTREFRTLLVRTYANALNEYADTAVTYLPLRSGEVVDDVTVRTEAEVAGGLPVPVDYKLHLAGGAWKVYDVAIDGLSLIADYRSTFAREIRKRGLDGLIARLAKRNRQTTK